MKRLLLAASVASPTGASHAAGRPTPSGAVVLAVGGAIRDRTDGVDARFGGPLPRGVPDAVDALGAAIGRAVRGGSFADMPAEVVE